jgi:hypothetical protein
VLAATQTPTEKEWFQGTADAVRQYSWLLSDVKNRVIEDVGAEGHTDKHQRLMLLCWPAFPLAKS